MHTSLSAVSALPVQSFHCLAHLALLYFISLIFKYIQSVFQCQYPKSIMLLYSVIRVLKHQLATHNTKMHAFILLIYGKCKSQYTQTFFIKTCNLTLVLWQRMKDKFYVYCPEQISSMEYRTPYVLEGIKMEAFYCSNIGVSSLMWHRYSSVHAIYAIQSNQY